MKGRIWWITLALVAAALVGAVLLFGSSWTSHGRLSVAPATSATPDKPVIDPTSAAVPETSEMLMMAQSAFLACGAPAAPTDMPDGKTATREQMVSAHETVKAFDEATTIYNQCLDTTAYQAAVQFKSVATEAENEALNSLQVRLHNEAIDRDQKLADRFNVQLRIFKARGNN
jgi:hypothetical protein